MAKLFVTFTAIIFNVHFQLDIATDKQGMNT